MPRSLKRLHNRLEWDIPIQLRLVHHVMRIFDLAAREDDAGEPLSHASGDLSVVDCWPVHVVSDKCFLLLCKALLDHADLLIVSSMHRADLENPAATATNKHLSSSLPAAIVPDSARSPGARR